jgi:formylglycine-generating enzyme required for sulfatase activity
VTPDLKSEKSPENRRVEWVADWYADNYYYVSPDSDPPGPANGPYRVLRGGGWYAAWEHLRAAFRFYSEPAGRYDGVGFRCAASAP